MVALSPREWEVLALLAANVGRVLTHRQLLTAVWGPAHAGDVQYLWVYVGQLRAKLGAVEGLLRTEASVGYRLTEGGLLIDVQARKLRFDLQFHGRSTSGSCHKPQ